MARDKKNKKNNDNDDRQGRSNNRGREPRPEPYATAYQRALLRVHDITPWECVRRGMTVQYVCDHIEWQAAEEAYATEYQKVLLAEHDLTPWDVARKGVPIQYMCDFLEKKKEKKEQKDRDKQAGRRMKPSPSPSRSRSSSSSSSSFSSSSSSEEADRADHHNQRKRRVTKAEMKAYTDKQKAESDKQKSLRQRRQRSKSSDSGTKSRLSSAPSLPRSARLEADSQSHANSDKKAAKSREIREVPRKTRSRTVKASKGGSRRSGRRRYRLPSPSPSPSRSGSSSSSSLSSSSSEEADGADHHNVKKRRVTKAEMKAYTDKQKAEAEKRKTERQKHTPRPARAPSPLERVMPLPEVKRDPRPPIPDRKVGVKWPEQPPDENTFTDAQAETDLLRRADLAGQNSRQWVAPAQGGFFRGEGSHRGGPLVVSREEINERNLRAQHRDVASSFTTVTENSSALTSSGQGCWRGSGRLGGPAALRRYEGRSSTGEAPPQNEERPIDGPLRQPGAHPPRRERHR